MAKKSGKLSKKRGRAQSVAQPSKYSLQQIKKFWAEVQVEFHKIAWPDKKQTVGSTGVVVFLVLLISIYLGGVDLILGKLIGYVLQ